MQDYYTAAHRLAARLDEEGFAAEAEQLRDAIRSGSTSMEILMRLRWELAHLSKSALVLTPSLRRDAANLEHAVGSALRP